MNDDDSTDDFRLSAPVEISPDARPPVKLPPSDEEKAKQELRPEERQFTLRELFGVMTFAAVIFSGFQWLSAGWLAFLLGVMACLGLALASVQQIRRPSLIFAWWIVLLTYLFACAVAIQRLH